MKISLLIAAIIVSLAALFGAKQGQTIKTLTTEWEDLKNTAQTKNIPTDLTVAFSSNRVRSESGRAAREEAIRDFASELAAFAQKMEDAQGSDLEESAEVQKEIISFIDKLTSMSPDDLRSLVKILAADTSIKEDTKKELMMMSIMMLSTENPEAALAIVAESSESLGLSGQGRQMLPMVIGQYAVKDPNGAASWILDNEELLGDNAKDIKMQIVAHAAGNGFQEALAMMQTLDLGEENGVYGSLAHGLKPGAQDDYLKALDAADLTTNQRKSAIASLINSPFMKEDFEKATAWLDRPEFPEADRETILQSLHYHSVREIPEKWLGWVSEQDSHKEIATRQILTGWTRENFVAAGEWVQSLETGASKDGAVKTYAETLAPHEPAAAADWADTLPEGSDRDNLFQTIHSSLKDKDPAAATALAEKYGLEIDSSE